MSRRLTLNTRERGQVDLYLIYNYAGTWEAHWRPLDGHPIGTLFPRMSHDMIEHAILGYSRPLVKTLGLHPKELLHKVPQTCEHAGVCTLYIKKDCLATVKAMPWCFEPAGLDSSVRALGSEVIRLLREQVYVVVVEEAADAG